MVNNFPKEEWVITHKNQSQLHRNTRDWAQWDTHFISPTRKGKKRKSREPSGTPILSPRLEKGKREKVDKKEGRKVI